MTREIYFANMCHVDSDENIKLVEMFLPYVRKACVVMGGAIGDSFLYWRNWSEVEPKLEVKLVPWADQFPKQRNEYLKMISQYIKPGDFLWSSDPDEYPIEDTLKKLGPIADEVERQGCNIACLQCRSESYKGKKKVHENVDKYWKHLYYRWEPGIHYDEAQNPHETLVFPSGSRRLNLGNLYVHAKQENAIWIRGCRNMFCGGGGPNLGAKNPYWVELRKLCQEIGINRWEEFHNLMIRGAAPQQITKWMIEHHNDNWGDGASEHREVYKTYFRIYHPEEEPLELRGKHIP